MILDKKCVSRRFQFRLSVFLSCEGTNIHCVTWPFFKMAVFQNGRFSKWPFFKMAIFQNRHFSKSPILKKNLRKFHGLVLGYIGLIDAKGIDVAEPIWL